MNGSKKRNRQRIKTNIKNILLSQVSISVTAKIQNSTQSGNKI